MTLANRTFMLGLRRKSGSRVSSIKEKAFLVTGMSLIDYLGLGNKTEEHCPGDILLDLGRNEEFGNCQSY